MPTHQKSKTLTEKSHLMMMIEDFKKDTNNSLKEIQKSTGKQLEDLKEETQKSLKELQENMTKQVKKLNKTIQNLKQEIETIKKSQRETTLEIKSLEKRPGVIDHQQNTRDGRENLRCRRYHRKHRYLTTVK
jgi:predicted  nucleic acid-binding Zn-ribbon protein